MNYDGITLANYWDNFENYDELNEIVQPLNLELPRVFLGLLLLLLFSY